MKRYFFLKKWGGCLIEHEKIYNKSNKKKFIIFFVFTNDDFSIFTNKKQFLYHFISYNILEKFKNFVF